LIPGSPVSVINKTDRQDINEILLKVALNTINHQPTLMPTFVFRIDMSSVYTGFVLINKDFQHWDLFKVQFIQDFGLF